jgi:nucleotide-binding universal stress UspA family protein
MFRILVPVDFFKTSFAAFDYAANFSQLFPDSEITMLHVISGGFNFDDTLVFDLMESKKDAALDKLAYFHQTYPSELGIDIPEVKIQKIVKFGFPGFTIAEYASNNDFDLVIMGTRDKHNLFDKMLGSASAITLRTAECPVLLIHENVKFNKPKKVVFAFDEKSDLEDALEDYWELNSILKAKTEFIHVDTKNKSDLQEQKSDIVEELFEDNDPSFSFEIKTIEGKDVHRTIKDYCLSGNSDLLIMVHRKEGLFKNIFSSNNSVRMAQEFHLPVLVYHEDT